MSLVILLISQSMQLRVIAQALELHRSGLVERMYSI